MNAPAEKTLPGRLRYLQGVFSFFSAFSNVDRINVNWFGFDIFSVFQLYCGRELKQLRYVRVCHSPGNETGFQGQFFFVLYTEDVYL